MPESRPKIIALFIPPTLGYFGDVVLGIQEFVRTGPRWVIEVCPTLDVARATCDKWLPDGILVNNTDGDWASFLMPLSRPPHNIPMVQVGGPALPDVARVSTDNAQIGHTAAEHFLERGIKRFAFCGYQNCDWSEEREGGYRDRLAAMGHTYIPFLGRLGEIYAGAVTNVLADFLRSLPRPIAIFACHDRAAMLLANTAAYLRIPVPDEIAILGVDNDLLECGFAAPPVSSIMGAARRVGFEGASLLHTLLSGGAAPAEALFVPPAGVVVRQSTDVLTTDDADVRAALRYIHHHAIDPIDVSDILRTVLVSRRSLERKFKIAINRTPSDEILRARLAHAKMLLLSTRLSIGDIATECGFPSPSKFSTVFTRHAHTSPKAFRQLYASRATTNTIAAGAYSFDG